MRQIITWRLLFLPLLASALVQAEGVESRTSLASSAQRVRGAVTLLPASTGLVALGGSALRVLNTGKTTWESIHRIVGDEVYRVAADDSGRLLVAWEKEANIHLFNPRTKQHTTFPKPVTSSPELREFGLQGLFFSKNGTDAIVYMEGTTGGTRWSTVGYRYDLTGKAEPKLLFTQSGHRLYLSSRIAVFAVPTDPRRSCDHQGCWPISEIAAYELSGAQPTRRVLLAGENRSYSVARMVRGGDDDRLAMVVSESGSKVRTLLRFHAGGGAVDVRPLPNRSSEPEASWLTKSNAFIEMGRPDGAPLEIKRHEPSGEVSVTTVPPFPHNDPDVVQDLKVHAIQERRNGELVLHWGDHLMLIAAGKPHRALNIEPLLKRRNEWASADVYAADTESLWVGIEVGGGRDFVQIPLADLEKRAQRSH